MAVLLVIRDLGKNAAFLKAMPVDSRSEEEVVIILLKHMPGQVPSARSLTPEQLALVEQSLKVVHAMLRH